MTRIVCHLFIDIECDGFPDMGRPTRDNRNQTSVFEKKNKKQTMKRVWVSSKRSDETTDETVNCLGSLSLQSDFSGYSHLNFSFHRIIYFFKANNCMDQVLRALAERLRGYICAKG